MGQSKRESRSWGPRLFVASVGLAVLAGGAGAVWTANARQSESAAQSILPSTAAVGVGAIGRLEPGWKVYQVSPTSGADGARVESLRVEEGDEVRAGAEIAVLDTRSRREAALLEARALASVSRAKLALIKAGTKKEDVSAQAAAVEQLKTSALKAEADFKRLEALRSSSALSAEEYDQRRFQFQMAQSALKQSESMLAALKIVRAEDVAVAEAELAKAEAGVARAVADLEAAIVRSPIAGRVLKVHARAGEKVGEGGLVEIGDTDAMHAVAEVYETDVSRVAVGLRATVKTPTTTGKLTGEVVHVGWKIGRKVTLDNDPVKDTDARVVEVRIRLDPASSTLVARLTYARVEVSIDTSPTTGEGR